MILSEAMNRRHCARIMSQAQGLGLGLGQDRALGQLRGIALAASLPCLPIIYHRVNRLARHAKRAARTRLYNAALY